MQVDSLANHSIVVAVEYESEDWREKINKLSELQPNGCKIWKMKPSSDGYGKITVNGITVRAHRLSFFLANPHITPFSDNIICHTCDNPMCVATYHLYEGSLSDNMQDMTNRNRCLKGWAKTQQIGNNVLSKEDVESIWTRACSNEKVDDIAADYRIHKNHVHMIRQQRIWADITNPLKEQGIVWNRQKRRIWSRHDPKSWKYKPAHIEITPSTAI